MRLISVFCFTLGTSGLAVLPLSAQLLSSPGSGFVAKQQKLLFGDS